MATLAVALARGLRAAQPVATDVPNGNLYFVTDEGVTEQSTGSAWVSYSGAGGAGTVTHTGGLTASAVVVGNGTDDLKVLGSLGTTTTLLHGNAAGLPTFATVDLTADVSGVLPVVNGGTGSTAGAAILVSITALTNAQIKALPVTGVVMATAVGSGFRLRPMAFSTWFNTNAGAYTNINATYADLHLEMGTDYVGYGIVNDSSTTPALTSLTDLLGVISQRGSDWLIPWVAVAHDGYALQQPYYNYNQQNNANIILKADNNGSLDFTGGHANNTGYCVLQYTVQALP